MKYSLTLKQINLILTVITMIIVVSCNSEDSQDQESSYYETCSECDEEVSMNSEYCENHECPECYELKDESDEYCENHLCPECGGLKDAYDETCEDCQEGGGYPLAVTTLKACADNLNVSESELAEYEHDFETNRNNPISIEMCELFAEYMTEIRALKRGRDALNNEMNEGYIQQVFAFSMHDNLVCHHVIVKRHGNYHWLEVMGNKKCKMGTVKFDPAISGWQDAIVKESPNDQTLDVYRMKMRGSSSDMSYLKSQIQNDCY